MRRDMQTEGYIFYGIVILVFGLLIYFDGRRSRLLRKRKKGLSYNDMAGVYTWTGLDGVQRRSEIHPEKSGGAWFDHHQQASGGFGSGSSVSDSGAPDESGGAGSE